MAEGNATVIEPGSLVLVTGANGFIGSHLVEVLLARGYRVRCMVRRSSDLSYIRHLPVEWAHADVRNADELRQACDGVQAVVHCAALTRALDEETIMRVNAGGAVQLARACIELNGPLCRFVLVSSQAAVGPSDGPDDVIDERRPARPVTWYGKSKLAAEQALTAISRESGRLPLTIVRPAAVMGPRDRDFLSYYRLIARRLDLQLGRQQRIVSLVHVADVVGLLLRVLKDERATGETFFACSYHASYADLAEAVGTALDRRAIRITLPVSALAVMAPFASLQGRLTKRPVLLNGQRLIDLRQPYWLCSGDKARSELGFEAEYDLVRTVRETAHWYRQEGWLS